VSVKLVQGRALVDADATCPRSAGKVVHDILLCINKVNVAIASKCAGEQCAKVLLKLVCTGAEPNHGHLV
jgi:hypothetical protein